MLRDLHCQHHLAMSAIWMMLLLLSCCCYHPVHGFFVMRPPGNNNPPPPRTPTARHLADGSDDLPNNNHHADSLFVNLLPSPEDEQEDVHEDTNTDADTEIHSGAGPTHALSRGGGSSSKTQQPPNAAHVLKGTQATLSTSASFWKRSFGKLGSTLTAPFRAGSKAVSRMFRSKEAFLEEQLLQELATMPIQQLDVNTTVLPESVVQLAARRSGLLGRPLRPESVQEFARTIKRWYLRHGYVLHSMTGASLEPETATAQITLHEPVISRKPMDIVFCKEYIIDEETGRLMTPRQYKEKHELRKSRGFRRKVADLSKANRTMVESPGRTSPERLAKALKLKPGRPFQWDDRRWKSIVQSGIFQNVLQTTPQKQPDGSVQMVIVAQEAPARHLEYGVGRSLYTGAWEGELDFEHANVLGGGETIGVSVSRGTKDAQPSVHVRYSDNHFGLEGGYEIEAFNDYLGGQNEKFSIGAKKPSSDDPMITPDKAIEMDEPQETQPESDSPTSDPMAAQPDYDHDLLKDRRGTTFRLFNPFDVKRIRHSTASCSFERLSTQSGFHENIGSCTLSLGPFERQLPLDARSNLDCKFTTGTRLQQKATFNKNEILDRFELRPYATASATTRQTFPLISTSTQNKRPVVLALRHSVTTSTPNLPRHEARAQGIANNIRDSSENGRISSAIRGTTELRIPVDIPKIKTFQDGKLVFFGDWLYATPDMKTPIYRKSSVGIGVRKSFQGIPVRYDLCYTWEGKIRGQIGLGRDFEA